MSVAAINVPDFDTERLRIARELHDIISYGFATISLQAGAAVQVAEERPQQAIEALDAIRLVSKDALEELRGILGVLRHSDGSGARGVGLDRLEALVESTKRAGVPTQLNASGCRTPLPSSVSRSAYRIVQEALANVLRHAGEASATVSIVEDDDQLRITVEDDGKGLNEAGASARSRIPRIPNPEPAVALALGGDLEAGPRPEGGFRVRAYLPMAVPS